ncbi:MAG: hypothetical protein DRO65_01530 [Candidatus Altiarchaeales archaeon]|nr:MAG: hypothetical protein DRO65_01530 [Candidatus Altiarchaeales archaeon]
MRDTVVVSFWLDEETYTRLKKLARKEKASISEVIRKALREYVKHLAQQHAEINNLVENLGGERKSNVQAKEI